MNDAPHPSPSDHPIGAAIGETRELPALRLNPAEIFAESAARWHLRLAATGAAWAVALSLVVAMFMMLKAFIDRTSDAVTFEFQDAGWMFHPIVAVTTTVVVALVVLIIALVRAAFSLTASTDSRERLDANPKKEATVPLPGIELVKALADSLSTAIKALGRSKSS